MKKFYLLLTFLVVGFSAKAAPAAADNFERRNYGDAFIFVERGVEFAVFPDGQFDFFYNPRGNFNRIPSHVNYSFNSGYNYGPFVQYDDFGAVIQIEDVPVFYDYYGRIVQAGRVQFRYNAFGQLNRIGNMFVHYNPYNHFSHTSGFINRWNTSYVYRPWHDHYMRPYSHYSIVYNEPYRLYYQPNRMKYNAYKRYYNNNNHNNSFQKSYYRPGERVTSYHRGRRVEEPREVRKHNSAPEVVAPSAPRQRVNEQREVRRTPAATKSADVNSRASRVETPAVVQQRAMQQRAAQRRTIRESRAASVPAQSSVQQQSRRSSPPARQMQAQTRRTERTATMNTVREQKSPDSTRGTRSSRGRN